MLSEHFKAAMEQDPSAYILAMPHYDGALLPGATSDCSGGAVQIRRFLACSMEGDEPHGAPLRRLEIPPGVGSHEAHPAHLVHQGHDPLEVGAAVGEIPTGLGWAFATSGPVPKGANDSLKGFQAPMP